MKFALFFISLISLGVNTSLSQDTKLKPETCRDYFSRTLVVELLEENPSTFDKIKRLLSTDVNRVNVYKRFIKEYNIYIQNAVKKHWRVNKKILSTSV